MENFLNPYILFSFSEPLKVLKGTFEGTKKTLLDDKLYFVVDVSLRVPGQHAGLHRSKSPVFSVQKFEQKRVILMVWERFETILMLLELFGSVFRTESEWYFDLWHQG